MKLFYSIFLFFWTIFIFLKYSYDRVKHGKFRGLLLFKLGLKKQKILRKEDKKCVWIHATSFGETLSMEVLVQKIKEQNDVYIIFSTFTSTGFDLAKKIKGVDQVIILPIDIKFLVRGLVNKIKPDLFILTESDYWFHLLNEVKSFGCKILLIGGRISDRSYKRFKKVSFFAKKLFNLFDFLLIQDEFMEKKFIELGVSKEKIQIIGNLKLDILEKKTLKEEKVFLTKNRKYITLGSTHNGEESLLLKELANLNENITFLLAPRKPERFLKVQTMLEQSNLSWRFVDDKGKGDERVIFINKLGLLQECYAKSDLAIVCGSFVKNVGGHNVFEPIKEGTPVIYGPYTHNQHSLTSIVEEFQVGEKASINELFSKVEFWLAKGRISNGIINKIKEKTAEPTEKAINLINSLL